MADPTPTSAPGAHPPGVAPPAGACASCGATLTGPFCSNCGERVPAAGDLSLRHAVTESFDILDSRAFRTFAALVRRPGRLTAEYVAGRRKPYLGPFQTFIIANIIFFAAAGMGIPVLTLTTPLGAHVSASPYDGFARELVQKRLGMIGADWDDVEVSPQYDRLRLVFNSNARNAANTLVIAFVPLYASALALLRVRRREPAGHHVAFSLHYLAFSLLFFVFIGILLIGVRSGPIAEAVAGDSAVIPVVVLSALSLYLAGAFRTAYRLTWPAAALHAVILTLLFMPFLVLYRLGLFLVVLRSI